MDVRQRLELRKRLMDRAGGGQSDVSFSAGLRPDQIQPPSLGVQQPNILGMDYSRLLPKKTQAEIVGGIGGVVGGNPLSIAAGATLGGQLYDKYAKDKEITPEGASKD